MENIELIGKPQYLEFEEKLIMTEQGIEVIRICSEFHKQLLKEDRDINEYKALELERRLFSIITNKFGLFHQLME